MLMKLTPGIFKKIAGPKLYLGLSRRNQKGMRIHSMQGDVNIVKETNS